MNRLQVRLSIAFSSVVLLAAILLVLSALFIAPERGTRLTGIVSQEDEIRIKAMIREKIPGALLSIALTGGTVGIAAGLWMSRHLTAPLDELADAAREIGEKNLSRRVEIRGSEEIMTVANAFNQMASKLQEAETLRQNLLSDVAHELRTPLTVLQGNLRAILDEVYPLDKAEITRLYEQSRHLSRLVNDLHELAQAEAKQLPLTLQETDVKKELQTSFLLFQPLAEEKKISLTFVPTPPVSHAKVDRARFKQALHNLLTNALRHTPQNGSVTIYLSQQNNQLRIAIQDTGEGIAPEHLTHIWNRFYRTARARDRHSGGTGLGLAITRAIIQAHDGQVSANSDGVGKGSTFTLYLPAR